MEYKYNSNYQRAFEQKMGEFVNMVRELIEEVTHDTVESFNANPMESRMEAFRLHQREDPYYHHEGPAEWFEQSYDEYVTTIDGQ